LHCIKWWNVALKVIWLMHNSSVNERFEVLAFNHSPPCFIHAEARIKRKKE